MKKGLQEGPPIWVESLLTINEYKECAKKYSTYQNLTPPLFNPDIYKGGKWRIK